DDRSGRDQERRHADTAPNRTENTEMATQAPVMTAPPKLSDGKPKGQGSPKALPAPNSDFSQLTDVLSAEEMSLVKKVRSYMETKVAPVINKYWTEDAFPFELLPSFKELKLGGLGYEGYGCAGG